MSVKHYHLRGLGEQHVSEALPFEGSGGHGPWKIFIFETDV